uniref:Uncharacterized protein n=1 Tax=Lactifluus piperatus TaxID=71966 RepID=A0A2Z4M942_9AGAM|nr:hypothetical protein [Lactifluus piperatus]AWX53019.1 hypothetical protein [Lactifluus piperatus]
MLNINFFLELILVLIAILVSNGILFSLKFLNTNKKNYLKIVYIKINNIGKDVLTPRVLIASNPIWLNSLESNSSDNLSINSFESSSSDTLSVNSLESSSSNTLSVNSLETNVSQNIIDNYNLENLRINEWTTLSNLDVVRPVDSLTVLNSQSLEQWREIVRDLHDLSIGSPPTLIQQVKFEELNILYSQDIIYFGITQPELRIIIEHVPTWQLFDPTINHFILTIMSYYHC